MKRDVERRPNVIWITLDSLKAAALPAYGNCFVDAPASRRVADRGVVISQAFTPMPKCVPARPAMIMGRYPHCEGLRALRGKAGCERRSDLFLVPDGAPNLIEYLHDRGYTTCAKGPNHMVAWDLYHRAFDVTMDWDSRKAAQPPTTCQDPQLLRAKYAGPVPGDWDPSDQSDVIATDQFCEFLRQQGRGGGPFFGILDLRGPHPAYRDWPPFAERYRDLDIPVPPKAPIERAPWTERVYRETYDLEGMSDDKWRVLIRAYYSAIDFNDMLVGRVLDEVDRLDLAENTIVIYSADHGDFAGEHGCVEKHDTFLYDCLTRLPLLIHLPEGYPRGRRADCMVEMIDVAPTIVELCGFEAPRWMQGRSFLPVLRGDTDEHKDTVFSQGGVEAEAIDRRRLVDDSFFAPVMRSAYGLKQKVILDYPEFMLRAKMVRTRRHKYIYRLNGRHELYDLEADPHELVNQIDNPDFAGVVEDLRERLMRFMLESETNLPLIDQVWA